MIHVRSLAISLMLLLTSSCFGMVFDNRFLPLMQRAWIAPDDGRSHLSTNLFAVTASNAYNKFGDQVPLPEIFGPFDLGLLAKAMVQLNYQEPIKSEWQGAIIPWVLQGKLQGQGLDVEWQKAFNCYVSLGGSFMLLRLNSWYEFLLDEKDDNFTMRRGLKHGDAEELEELRRSILQKLGFCGDHSHERGIGDIDLYLRFGNYWEYELKFRSIQAGGRLGILIPTAKPRNIHYPASIPFGGDRHWGIYGAIDAIFELKEDWKVGIYLRANKRFSRVSCQRVPICCEPDNFGALQADVNVRPGVTVVASPFVSFECLRDGFGIRGYYTLTKHWRDKWNLHRSSSTSDLKELCNRTAWGSDYFSINVFYDFGKVKPDRIVYPILTFCWDIPSNVLIANTVAKTNRISLGVEVAF